LQQLTATISTNDFDCKTVGRLAFQIEAAGVHTSLLSNLKIDTTELLNVYKNDGIQEFLKNINEAIFIVNDSNRKVLYFGVDAFAIKPIFYAKIQGNLLIDSDLKSIVDRVKEGTLINNRKLSAYFNWNADELPADNETFYEGIFRLLPGQIGCYENEKLNFLNSWKALGPLTKEDYADAFREQFEKSVLRERNAIKLSANLSGGLDSSAVTSVLATEKVVKTIYFDARTTESDEKEYADELSEKYQVEQISVFPPGNLYHSLKEVTRAISQPDPSVLPSFIHERIIYDALKNGSEVLYSGHGGDSVVSYGYEYLDELLEASDWSKFEKACEQYDSFRHNERSIAESLIKTKVKKAIKKRELLKTAKLLFAGITRFGIKLPVHRKETQIRDYKYFENRILLKKASVTKSTKQFDSVSIAANLSKYQKAHFDFNFIRLGINGNEVLSLLGHQKDIGVSFPFFEKNYLRLP
jgi:asparagine synthetase B (glutamine-hydrolysing)